jgi:hypothetical protein
MDAVPVGCSFVRTNRRHGSTYARVEIVKQVWSNFVVLSRASLNIARLSTEGGAVPGQPSRFSNPRRYLRSRVTASLARDVTARYQRGESMRAIALALGLGKATVLKILHAAEVPIRPTGRHYSR